MIHKFRKTSVLIKHKANGPVAHQYVFLFFKSNLLNVYTKI